jgi:uncharacterized protein YcbK (DUF882 family)
MKSEFASWFEDQKFRNFDAKELEWYFSKVRNGVRNTIPPRILWKNIVPTLRILDDLRDELKAPVVISSTYRAPGYNRAVRGKKDSRHLLFDAVDFSARGVTPSRAAAVLIQWRNDGRFRGGVGVYPRFVHVDTRGVNATW